MPTILRRQSSPLMSLGDLVFDVELSVSRGGRREISERRLASGATVSDHSRRLPRTFRVTGAVSALPQPQNVGRPGAPGAQATLESLGDQATAGLDLSRSSSPTRVQDFETRLDRLQDDGEFAEVELVSKVVGRPMVVLEEWEATATGDDGMSATYSLTLREVQRAGLTISQATPESLALVGTGGAPQPGGGGPSQSTPLLLEVVP